jgi:predicted HD superfamily hydrolase involved in NAD metabolism
MKREEWLEKAKAQMTDHRFIHTLGVAQTAIELAGKYGADPEKADLAGILHDYCKFWDKAKMREIIMQDPSVEKDLLNYDKELWHAPAGAYIVKNDLGIKDEEITNAIRFHTSGRPNMSKLEKIIWLADYIEPGRHFPGVDEVRELAARSLDHALIQAFANTIGFLVQHGRRVYPLTLYTYNDLVKNNT